MEGTEQLERSPPSWLAALAEFSRLYARNRLAAWGAAVVCVFIILAIFAPFIAPHDPTEPDLSRSLQPPAWQAGGSLHYPLGCDQMGRDLLSRIIHGSRVSLLLGIAVVILTLLMGTALGVLAGYFADWVDAVVSRVVDILLAFPLIVFALGIIAALGPGMLNLVLALTFKGWVDFARLARAGALSEKASPYVEAARSVGQAICT